MSQSKIEYTHCTWNPVTGCSRVSAGCAHCYAERMARRLQAMGTPRYRQGFRVTLHADDLRKPIHWRKPRIIFVNSMSDMFHEQVPLSFIQRVFSIMTQCPQHIFQVLTKRSERMRELSPRLPWPDNLWMGVTVESNRYFSRIDDLRAVPSAVRFLSCEPLLSSLEGIDLVGIDWVIAGGESGPKARPMKPEWARDLRDCCSRQGTAFFFKQWGGANRRATGRRLDGRLYSEVPPQLAVHDPQLSLGL